MIFVPVIDKRGYKPAITVKITPMMNPFWRCAGFIGRASNSAPTSVSASKKKSWRIYKYKARDKPIPANTPVALPISPIIITS